MVTMDSSQGLSGDWKHKGTGQRGFPVECWDQVGLFGHHDRWRGWAANVGTELTRGRGSKAA